MVNYFYNAQVYEFEKSYGSYLGIDAASLSTQVYNEETGATWADLLMEQALNTAAQTYAIYDEAIANGAALTEDDQSQIDTTISSYEQVAKQSGYANANAYLAAGFGAGCNTKNFAEYLTVTTIAADYQQQVNDGFTYTAEDLAAEYEAKPANYNTYTYRQFLISDSLFQTDDNALSEEELAEKKEALATEMAASTQGDEQAFIDAAYENAAESNKDSLCRRATRSAPPSAPPSSRRSATGSPTVLVRKATPLPLMWTAHGMSSTTSPATSTTGSCRTSARSPSPRPTPLTKTP